MLKLRESRADLTRGDFRALPSRGPLFAYCRHYESQESMVLVNLSKKPVKLPSYLRQIDGKTLLGFNLGEDLSALAPYEARIIDLG